MAKKKLNIKPTPGYLLLEPLEKEGKTSAGIYLPESASEKPQKGRVIAVSDDEVTDSGAKRKSPAKKGDIVIYKKWGGDEVKIGNEEYKIISQEDILAILEN